VSERQTEVCRTSGAILIHYPDTRSFDSCPAAASEVFALSELPFNGRGDMTSQTMIRYALTADYGLRFKQSLRSRAR
jgi:hypothetical protein